MTVIMLDLLLNKALSGAIYLSLTATDHSSSQLIETADWPSRKISFNSMEKSLLSTYSNTVSQTG